ncbi:unnamed protein product, partial [Prorocentrum cordatum]
EVATVTHGEDVSKGLLEAMVEALRVDGDDGVEDRADDALDDSGVVRSKLVSKRVQCKKT